MKLIVCDNKHVYDGEVYGWQCPFCRKKEEAAKQKRSENRDHAENTMRMPWGFRNRAAKPANDWTRPVAVAAQTKAVPGAPAAKSAEDAAVPELNDQLYKTFNVRQPAEAEEAPVKLSPVEPAADAPVEEDARPVQNEEVYKTFNVRDGAEVQPAEAEEAPVKLSPVEPAQETPVEEDARPEQPDNSAEAVEEAAEAVEAVEAAEVAEVGEELFVAELDEMDPEMRAQDDAGEEDADDAEREWNPEAQMEIAVQLVDADAAEEDSAAEAQPDEPKSEAVINAPSNYKPMWDAKVGAEDQAMAEDFSMVMEEAAMAAMPENQAMYTPIVSVSELMESEDPGEAPDAWEDEWENSNPGLVRISSLDAIEDFRNVDAGILEDVDDDVLLSHKDKADSEFADYTHVTVHLVPAASEKGEEKKPADVPVEVAPAAPAAPVIRKPAAPVVGWLVCIDGAHYGENFPLVTGRNSIGRAPEMNVPLLKDEGVTEGRHAVLTYEPRKRQFFIQPGESTGLVYLNDELVLQYAALKAYDRIEFDCDVYLFMPLCGPSFGWDAAKEVAQGTKE